LVGRTRIAALLAVSAAVVLSPGVDARLPAAQCPDPTLLVERTVTLVCTGQSGFPARSAATIAGLRNARPHPAFAAGGWPRWADDGYWAPDLKHVGNRYLLYFSARRRSDDRHCIGVAVSNRPSGGFRDSGRPLIADEPDGAIDPALLSDSGRLFLFYKRDGNSVGARSAIFGLRLSAGGLRVAGPRTALLRSQAHGWEHGVIEAPAPIQVGAVTYLFFSGGTFSRPGYAEGEAMRSGGPLGAYHRLGSTPVLHGDGSWVGTGGGSVVVDGGRLLLAYEAFRPGRPTVRRVLFIRPLGLVNGILIPVGRRHEIALLR
jgi:beta-xylosidase